VAEPENLMTSHFTTDDLPERDRVAMWREHYGRIAFGVEIEPQAETPFHARMSATAVPGLQLFRGTMSAATVTRTRSCIADGNSDFALVLNRTGATTATARGREVTLGEGDAILMSSDEVTAFSRGEAGSSCALRLSRTLLSSLVANVDDTVMRRIAPDAHALRMLEGYVKALCKGGGLSSPQLRQVAVPHVYDLVALTLGATREVGQLARTRGVQAARLELAKSFIAENSHRQDLSVGIAAAHLGVTIRYLQRLFEADDTTFSKFVLDRRLARAHRMLSDQQFLGRSVSTIAYDAGFGDLSYFNRSFQRSYRMTPTEIRQTVGK
jgi:AraC-like DNA-binding protein